MLQMFTKLESVVQKVKR